MPENETLRRIEKIVSTLDLDHSKRIFGKQRK